MADGSAAPKTATKSIEDKIDAIHAFVTNTTSADVKALRADIEKRDAAIKELRTGLEAISDLADVDVANRGVIARDALAKAEAALK